MIDIVKVPVVYLANGRVLYSLQPKQYEFYKMTPLYRRPDEEGPVYLGFGGAAGGGKSYVSRAILTAVAMMWPGSTSIIFRRTEREVVANHVNKLRSEVPDKIDHQRMYSYNAQDLIATWANGSKTYFGYLKQDDDVFTYQGPEYDVMIFEESTQYSQFQVTWLTGNRLRATVPGARPFALFPSNPGGKGHHWYKRWFIQRRFHRDDGENPADFAFLQSKLDDNQELMQRDPRYAEKLNRLPEPYRSWQRDGDFAAGAGAALAEIDRERHLVKPFEIPPHWPVFGSFDWGFQHPFSFGFYATTEDGDIYKIDTVTGRHLKPNEIAERVQARMEKWGITKFRYITAGHDVKARQKARGEDTPTILEKFSEYELHLSLANIDRKMGLQALRQALAWRSMGLDGGDGEPQLRFFDTDSNRKCIEQLEQRVVDPDDPEDVLKTDADEWGEGGDDFYDETRYAIASRPQAARSHWGTAEQPGAFSPVMLQAERERLMRGRGDHPRRPRDHVQDADNAWEVL